MNVGSEIQRVKGSAQPVFEYISGFVGVRFLNQLRRLLQNLICFFKHTWRRKKRKWIAVHNVRTISVGGNESDSLMRGEPRKWLRGLAGFRIRCVLKQGWLAIGAGRPFCT